jgi:hypothetical protein
MTPQASRERPDAQQLWTLRALVAVSVLLALLCMALALMWRAKADEAACYQDALAEGATPAVADIDCAPRHR